MASSTTTSGPPSASPKIVDTYKVNVNSSVLQDSLLTASSGTTNGGLFSNNQPQSGLDTFLNY